MIIFISSFAADVLIICIAILIMGIIKGFDPMFEWLDTNQLTIAIIVLVLSVIVSLIYTHFENIYSKEKGSAGILGYINRMLLVPPLIVAAIDIIIEVLSGFADMNIVILLFAGVFMLGITVLISIAILFLAYFVVIKGSEIVFEITGKIGLVLYTILLAGIEVYFLYKFDFLPFLY